MPKIEKVLPFAATLYLLIKLYSLGEELLNEHSSLISFLDNLVNFRFYNLPYYHFPWLLSYIALFLLLFGLTKYFIQKEKHINNSIILSLAFFSFNSLHDLPKYTLRILNIQPTNYPSLSTSQHIQTNISFIAMIIVFIFFIERRKKIQKPKFPVPSEKCEINPYRKHLELGKNTSGFKRFFNYLFDVAIIGSWSTITFHFYAGASNGVISFSILFNIYFFIYTGLTEAISGQTLGKFITGTMVQFQEKDAFPCAFKRSLCRLIPFEVFSFFTHGNYGWHDTLTDTYVADIIGKGTESNIDNLTSNILDSSEAIQEN